MLARLRAAKENGEGGFTLIELLVVMIIIGILAAVAIPVFLSQRTKAQDSATKADASTVGKEVATYYVDSTTAPVVAQTAGGRYTIQAGTTGTPTDIGAASSNVTYNAGGSQFTSATVWCVAFTNSSTNTKKFVYSAGGGLQEGTCEAGVRKA